MKISALNRKLHRAFGGRVTAALADGCIVLRGELDRWDDVVRAGQMAATKYSTCHVVNDITFTGGKDAPMRVPALHDDALDGQTPDVLIIGGTSLVVYPAAGLIQYYRGHKLAVINKGGAGSGLGAAVTIDGPIGQVMAQL